MSSLQFEEKEVEGSVSIFLKEMKSLVNNAEFSDISFLVGPEKVVFKAHKCILATRCHVFKSMFESPLEVDEPLVLSDISPDIFSIMLQYIYTNCCKINPDNVMPLLSIAMEYGIEQLVKICEKYISESINIENACCAIQAAVTFGLDNFKRTLLPFIEKNTADIFNTKSFNELSDTTLSYILQSDELNMDEYDLLKAVRGWAVVNSVALGRPICEIARDVVCNLRLSLLTAEELGKIETENIKEHLIPVEQISMAWKHSALKTALNSTLETTVRKGTVKRTNNRVAHD